ncbi:MAG: phenylacetate--CoA ligase family protein [Bacteroidetes bacterium]|nr:phenylacetate--CoA ligase family protein [Bacteroidota bacterium]
MNVYSYLVRNISFPLLAHHFGLPHIMRQLKNFEKSQYWSKDKIEGFQIERLRALLTHAYRSTSYYKQLFDEASFKPEKMISLDDIKILPLLTKNIIRNRGNDLLSTVYNSDQVHFSETGGTTGVKMKFWRDNACLTPKEASRYRFEKWTGWDIGDRMGLAWPAQQDYVGHWTTKAKIKNELFERQVVFPAAIMDDENIKNYLHLLQKKKPTMIRAFTSPVYEVARVALDKNMQCDSIKGIVTTGEPLYPHQRQVIEKAFGCKVFDSYRSREAGPLAQECEKHNGYHINTESLVVEIVRSKDQDHLEPGIGEIVITDLLNFGMPLIRYKMGDVGIISDRQCSCGRGLPLLEKVMGRSVDILQAPDGKKITAGSLVLYLVDEAPGVLGQVQIVQDEIDHLLIRMTPDPIPTQEIKNYQKNTVKRLFGADMKVSFEIVETIQRSKSGKYQFAKYMVKE